MKQLFQSSKPKYDQQQIDEEIRLHVAGMTVRHGAKFKDLISYKNDFKLDQEFISEWLLPFYMKIGSTDEDWCRQLQDVEPKLSKDVVIKLLGDFNWRTRSTGAFFAGLKGFGDLSDIIGTHLMKSELTYAGKTYAYALAALNTEKAVEYLDEYLDYYLLQPGLWFDQRQVLESLTYLDTINNTQRAFRHTENWLKFLNNKPQWNREITTTGVEAQMELFRKIRANAITNINSPDLKH